MNPHHPHLFDPVTGDLLPQYRDAYLQNRLAPATAQAVEEYLKNSPIQKRIVLGRYHELAAAARLQRRSVAAPLWVQQQLIFQPSVSKAGPLRRPVLQLVLGLFLALSLASVVQWIRNEPPVPAPVTVAVVQAASRVSATTRHLAQSSLVSLRLAKPTPPVALGRSGRLAPISPAVARPVALTDTAAGRLASPAATAVRSRTYNQ